MDILGKNVKMNVSFIIGVLLLISTIVVGIIFFQTDDSKMGTVLGSLFAGLVVAIVQFAISWQDYKQTEKLKELELIRFLYNRDDRTFYENFIKKAKRKVFLMGVTALRFFKDFADYELSATSNAKVLLYVLEQGVSVKILLPGSDFIPENKKSDFETVRNHIRDIKEKHPAYSLEVKYFKHNPAHSILIIDDTCIVGPVFPKIESKYTPALHLKNSSQMADEYRKYFDIEWENSNE
jgi:hypothetical protein